MSDRVCERCTHLPKGSDRCPIEGRLVVPWEHTCDQWTARPQPMTAPAGAPAPWRPDPVDVQLAVTLLDDFALTRPHGDVVWELSRITNPVHGAWPMGEGFGVLVTFWDAKQHRHPAWEKAGKGRSVAEAARRVIARIQEAIHEPAE